MTQGSNQRSDWVDCTAWSAAGPAAVRPVAGRRHRRGGRARCAGGTTAAGEVSRQPGRDRDARRAAGGTRGGARAPDRRPDVRRVGVSRVPAARSARIGRCWDRASTPLWQAYDVAMLDLDGVVYVGPDAVPGAPEHLERARAAGMHLAYVTNNASRPPGDVARAPARARGSRSRTPTWSPPRRPPRALLADDLPEGSKVFLIGGEGLDDGAAGAWAGAGDQRRRTTRSPWSRATAPTCRGGRSSPGRSSCATGCRGSRPTPT